MSKILCTECNGLNSMYVKDVEDCKKSSIYTGFGAMGEKPYVSAFQNFFRLKIR